MSVEIIEKSNEEIIIQLKVKISKDMMDCENNIQNILNEGGAILTREALKGFDTDGSPIIMAGVKFTSKGLQPKTYQTPYGETFLHRHVYQTSAGGEQFCPLEESARIVLTSTPRFASQITNKYAEMPAGVVSRDLANNHNRPFSKSLIQDVANVVAHAIQAKEQVWDYEPPIQEKEVKTCVYGMDGANILMADGDWRQAVVGTISLYDEEGTRLHTTYCAASPEHGKATFKERMEREILRNKELYPTATRLGIADGALENWTFLKEHTQSQILDFYHAAEYIGEVGNALFFDEDFCKKWIDNRCHQLKHFVGSPLEILNEVRSIYKNVLSKTNPTSFVFKHKIFNKENTEKPPTIKTDTVDIENALNKNIDTSKIDKFISYFQNNITNNRMCYAENIALNYPIGSGVTESACKMVVKSRLCQSGMRWKDDGAKIILTLRALSRSDGKWDQFWQKVNQYGFPKRTTPLRKKKTKTVS